MAIMLCAPIVAALAQAQSADTSAQKQSSSDMNMEMAHDSMQHMDHGADRSLNFLMTESSGTAFQPSAWPMPMLMTSAGNWSLMWMGQAFLVDTQQTGPLGADKLYSVNWGMLSAIHRLWSGNVMLRTMLSLEPATITDRRYPLLFQTGETAYGEPITNAQHPHNFVMELSVQYAHPLGSQAVGYVYYAVMGDIALGPVAYPHRASAMEIPQATLGHHWEDSTHILSNVITAGLSLKTLRFEASGFHGAEPGENRWTIPFGPMDSYSGRISFTPSSRWVAQVSAGRMAHPEALEPGDIVRTTASVEYVMPRPQGTWWATSLVWGRNWKTAPKYGTDAVLAETVVPFSGKNFVTARYEWTQKDELFGHENQVFGGTTARDAVPVFNVNAYTAGYTRDLGTFFNVETGLGANVTAYSIPDAIKTYYGDHPMGFNVYLRVRLKESR